MELPTQDPEEPSQVGESSRASGGLDSSEAGCEIQTRYEEWGPVVKAVETATRDAFPSSPPFSADTAAEFRSYWSHVFVGLRDSVLANPDIPEYLTSPPLKEFRIRWFDELDPLCCPYGDPDFMPSITIRRDTGVTKVDLVESLNAALYGESPATVYHQDSYDHSTPDGETDGEVVEPTTNDDVQDVIPNQGLLIYQSDWMIEGGGEDGRREVYTEIYAGREAPAIWLYCCSLDQFAEKRRAVEEEERKRDETR